MVREAYRRAGHGLRVLPLPLERALQIANAGIDGGSAYRALGFEMDYPDLALAPQRILEQDLLALSRRTGIEVRGWLEVVRCAVGSVTGTKIVEPQLQGVAEQTSVRENAVLLGLIAADRVDVVLINRWACYLALGAQPLSSEHHGFLNEALFNGNGGAKKLIVALVLFSSVITALITAVGLYAR